MSGKAQQARTSQTILQNAAQSTATRHPPSIVQAMASTPLGRLAEAVRTSPVLQARAAAMPNRTGLPDGLKANVEAMSGFSMDDVRVHRNSPKPAQLHAHAYAQGTDIHLAPGQEKHLAHEAWHVVQQKQGRVLPTMQLKGVRVNDDAGLEREADVIGAKLGIRRDVTPRGQQLNGSTTPQRDPSYVDRLSDAQLVVQRAKYRWDGKAWIPDGDSSSEKAETPSRNGQFEGEIFDDITGQYFPASLDTKSSFDTNSSSSKEAPREASNPFGKWRAVSASSAHHDLKLIKAKAPSAASKSYGFSFVDKKDEKGDVDAINLFMRQILNGENAPSPAVIYGPATHHGAKEGMIQFTVNGRTYSTHAETSQLFPVSGDGILSGIGQDEMINTLKAINKLDIENFYKIRIASQDNPKPWKQISNNEKKKYQEQFKLVN